MIASHAKPRLLGSLAYGAPDQPVIWAPVDFARDLVERVLPNAIEVVKSSRTFSDFSLFTGFSEVLDHWYLVREATTIRNLPQPAYFTKASERGWYFVYIRIPQQFKADHAAAWSQLMEVGQPIGITFWPEGTTLAAAGRRTRWTRRYCIAMTA